MKTYNLILEPDDWTNTVSYRVMWLWKWHSDKLYAMLNKHERLAHRHDYKLSGYTIFREIDLMSRPKGKSNGSTERTKASFDRKPLSGNNIIWCNRRFEDDDFDQLIASDATLDYLLARLAQMVDDGHGVSLKSTDMGKSRSCTIIGPDPNDSSKSYGLSGFGTSVRDAVLSAVYKYDIWLEGDFANAASLNSDYEQGRRFR